MSTTRINGEAHLSPDRHATFCAELPKAELHLHIEGTLTPEQRLVIARRNQLEAGALTLEAIEHARNFGNTGTPQGDLREMLDYYYQGLDVLRVEADFFGISYDYLRTCRAENVRYAELSFDPQAHTTRGVPISNVINGLRRGVEAGEKAFGVKAQLILCINRDRSVESAFEALRAAEPFREFISGVGLDSLEEGNPPVKFKAVYAEARSQGYRLTAHCDVDQQDSVKHIWQCIDELGVERIDHGINCIEDTQLVAALIDRKVCLTACPTWRPRDAGPRRVDRVRRMLDLGLRVTINSDDPGVLSSRTLGHMLPLVAEAGKFTREELGRLSIHAFEGAWCPVEDRVKYLDDVRTYVARHALSAPQGQ